MIKIERTEVLGWEHAIRGMRNPMNSWDKSDSGMVCLNPVDAELGETPEYEFEIGKADHKRMMQLAKAGTDHRKYLRMIVVYCDITAPLYWHKEMDTYRFGVEKNSCSTMHKIADKEFELDDFSHEQILSETDEDDMDGVGICPYMADGYYGEWSPEAVFDVVIDMLNACRKKYLETKDKKFWWQMIQLLPSSYNQKRTYMISYEALANMYHSRKSHRLDEWVDFCKWIESLPYSELITGGKNADK